MKVAVVGSGYVGLVTGCCLAEIGHDVSCIDNDQSKIADLKAGQLSIYEPDLEDILKSGRQAERLHFTSDLAAGVKDAEAIFLALPTPSKDDGGADLSAVTAVAESLSSVMPNNYCVVINKSTVPVGTAKKVKQIISRQTKADFDVVSNPEFLREGHAVKDFMEPERIVVGAENDRAKQLMSQLYKPISERSTLYLTDSTTAELIKYAANSFLVTKVSFMNELAQLSELMGADVDLLRQALGADSRIGPKFLQPGIGCGGSCFPKDIKALLKMSDDLGYKFQILDSAMAVNQRQQHLLVKKIRQHFHDKLDGLCLAVWGLAFKPQTDDIREAPSLVIIDELIKDGVKIKAYDPEANPNVKRRYKDQPNLTVVEDKLEALDRADGLIIATEWPEFINSDINQIANRLKVPLVFDGRNIFKPDTMAAAGYQYYSVGRPPAGQN